MSEAYCLNQGSIVQCRNWPLASSGSRETPRCSDWQLCCASLPSGCAPLEDCLYGRKIQDWWEFFHSRHTPRSLASKNRWSHCCGWYKGLPQHWLWSLDRTSRQGTGKSEERSWFWRKFGFCLRGTSFSAALHWGSIQWSWTSLSFRCIQLQLLYQEYLWKSWASVQSLHLSPSCAWSLVGKKIPGRAISTRNLTMSDLLALTINSKVGKSFLSEDLAVLCDLIFCGDFSHRLLCRFFCHRHDPWLTLVQKRCGWGVGVSLRASGRSITVVLFRALH